MRFQLQFALVLPVLFSFAAAQQSTPSAPPPASSSQSSSSSSSNNIPVPWLQAIGAVPTLIDDPWIVDLKLRTGDDGNVFNVAHNAVNSELIEPGAHVSWHQEAWMEREQVYVDYDGDGVIYPRFSAVNQGSQGLAFHAEVQPSVRWDVRLNNGTTMESGLLFLTPHAQADVVTVQPLAGNPGVATPYASQWDNITRLDASYQTSQNGSVDVFSSYRLQRFRNVGANASLLDSTDFTTGATYVYRMARNWWVGPTMSFERLRFGDASNAGLTTASGALTWQASPVWTLVGFAGAQYVNLNQQFQQNLFGSLVTIQSDSKNWHPQMGGSVERRWDWLSATLSAQRSITDGGGLLTTVTDTFEQLKLALPQDAAQALGWQIDWYLSNNSSRSLSPGFSQGVIRDQRAGLTISRRLSDRSALEFSDQFVRQRAVGLPNIDSATRNIATVGLSFRLAGPPQGSISQ
ncbi:MAG TPA: hypothetical protein VN709_02775 [Terriglobales bacterium]|nr:hypothetical protein [Terriglobales bacterium]